GVAVFEVDARDVADLDAGDGDLLPLPRGDCLRARELRLHRVGALPGPAEVLLGEDHDRGRGPDRDQLAPVAPDLPAQAHRPPPLNLLRTLWAVGVPGGDVQRTCALTGVKPPGPVSARRSGRASWLQGTSGRSGGASAGLRGREPRIGFCANPNSRPSGSPNGVVTSSWPKPA